MTENRVNPIRFVVVQRYAKNIERAIFMVINFGYVNDK